MLEYSTVSLYDKTIYFHRLILEKIFTFEYKQSINFVN